MAGITLGNFFQSGGKTVSGGAGGSGIDTQSLIKGLTEAKAIPATKLQDQIKLNDSKSAALNEFKTTLSKLSEAVAALRNPPGVGNAADNAFKYRTTNISSNTSVSGSSYVSVTAAPGAALQNYTISDITSLAAAKKQSTGNISIASADSAAVSNTPASGQFKAGTFTLKGQSLTFNDGETLNSVAAKFNAVSDKTGISASIVQVSTGNYQISFAATKSGTANDFDFNNLSPAGTLVDGSGVFSTLTITKTQDAADAVFSLNNVPITRSSNTITDLVDGLTFNISQTTVSAPTTEIDIAVQADQAIAKNSIVNFMNAYNDLKNFEAKQNELNADGTYKDTAVLHSDSSFRSTLSAIKSQISSVVNGLSQVVANVWDGKPSRLSDLGITFTDQAATADTPEVRNILTVDDAKLESAISANPDAVRKVFEFDFNSDNTALRVFARSNSLAASSFSLSVNPFATQTTDAISVADADTSIVDLSPPSGHFRAGTFTINGQSIALSVGDSLNTIVSKFEAVKATTGVSASLQNVGSGQYKLVFTSTVTGTGKNFDLTSTALNPDDIFHGVGITVVGSYKATYNNGAGDVTIDVDATAIKNSSSGLVSSYSLKGKAGTVLEGLQLVYAATTAGTANVTTTQGIADKIFNVADSALKTSTGTIDVALSSLKDSDARLNDNITKINDQVEVYRQQLIDQFAKMEEAISRVNNILSSITASDNARNGTSN